MPDELQKLRMADSAMTVAEFIGSRPSASRPFLLAAVSEIGRASCRERVLPTV